MNENQKNILEMLNDGPTAIIGVPGDGKITKLVVIMKKADKSCFNISLRLLTSESDFAMAVETCAQYARSFPDSDIYLILDEASPDMSEEVLKALETFVTERRIGERTYPGNLKPVIVMNYDGNLRKIQERFPFLKHMLFNDNSQPMPDDVAEGVLRLEELLKGGRT